MICVYALCRLVSYLGMLLKWDPKEENVKETFGNNLYNAGKNIDVSSYESITL